MPGMAHLATLFDQLPDPHARRDALDAILGNLSTHEWRHLINKLPDHLFAQDIVGSLPVELVALIFSHLPPNAPFLYQTVSRRWRDVLSSSHVISLTLAQWYSDADPKLQGEIEGLVDDVYATQRLKAEHAWRFQRNRPFSIRHYSLPLIVTWNDFNVACEGDTICWLDEASDERLVRLCNLRTGENIAIAGEAREHILLLSLSTKIVAFLAIGGCYVYDLQIREATYFRLPRTGSSKTMAITTQDHTVAVAYYKHPHTEANVYLHSAQEQKTRHFLAKVPAHSDDPIGLTLTAVILNKDRDMVTLFFIDHGAWDGQQYNDLYSTSYSFTGEQLHRDSASRLDAGKRRTAFLKIPQAIDYTNRTHVFEGCAMAGRATLLYFDNHEGRFTRQVICRQASTNLDATVFMWKGVAFTTPWTRGGDFLRGLSNCEICRSHELHDIGLPTDDGDLVLVGNETFLVAFARDFCTVFCFDKHITLPFDIVSRGTLTDQDP